MSLNPNPKSSAPIPIAGNQLAGVVLVGGKSARMGQPKSDLPIGEETFLERIVRQIKMVASTVVIVGSFDRQKHRLPSDVIFEVDRRNNAGPVEGIRVGLKALASTNSMAFVTSCDSPLLKTEFIQTLLQLTTAAGIAPFQTRGDSEKRIFGLSSIYPTSVHQTIDQSIQRNRLRVKDIVVDCGLELINVERLREADPALDTLFNVNTTDDYEQLKRIQNTPSRDEPEI